MTARSLQPGYFDQLYAADPDPWRMESSAYEDAKYSATLAALPRAHYPRAIEIGCSVGVLTARLAARCDDLLALDVARAALDRAAQRCHGLPVRFALSTLPETPPPGRFDLIVLSEVLYYFDSAGVARLAAAVSAMAAPDADIVLVHWLGETPDYPLTGEEAVAAFKSAGAWQVRQRARTPDYRLDLLSIARSG
ncbi:class I SAM-dependent DNA methyltransferase [Sphingomonas qilianensis]|uniref:SAM-dependent methyltransferase n=1 Tax=Sphingomonas qilianensis TaxID=1736690 RepID=A0ABU9XUS3_9SPHN